ncbi:MAG: hypothetical protein IPM23_11715 [Candidatus Melainabacteria bacterium]|nr:hypothetical protein [Candidatus Melainabacteria bacterium]
MVVRIELYVQILGPIIENLMLSGIASVYELIGLDIHVALDEVIELVGDKDSGGSPVILKLLGTCVRFDGGGLEASGRQGCRN